jgi:hypothetical protein
MRNEGRLEGRELRTRDIRVDAGCDVTVHCSAGDLEGRIVNLSSEGFRLHSAAALEPGWEILLSAVNQSPVKAVICWASGQDSGGVFLEAAAL